MILKKHVKEEERCVPPSCHPDRSSDPHGITDMSEVAGQSETILSVCLPTTCQSCQTTARVVEGTPVPPDTREHGKTGHYFSRAKLATTSAGQNWSLLQQSKIDHYFSRAKLTTTFSMAKLITTLGRAQLTTEFSSWTSEDISPAGRYRYGARPVTGLAERCPERHATDGPGHRAEVNQRSTTQGNHPNNLLHTTYRI
ncbi:hypothetical protein Bbelb_000530 [Branchiostoma belcheri]|nr:hypothetical protein Bbelb_000530 [Branchiostoma belcheri]